MKAERRRKWERECNRCAGWFSSDHPSGMPSCTVHSLRSSTPGRTSVGSPDPVAKQTKKPNKATTNRERVIAVLCCAVAV